MRSGHRYDDAVAEEWVQNPDVIATDLDDELVLLHRTTRAVFTLNETGRTVWQELEEPRTVDAVVEAVTRAFTVDQATAHADVSQLLSELAAADLARPR